MELKKKQQGFTLVELLIVIVIVGILAAIAIPIYRGQTLKARLSEVTNAISHVSSAAAAFFQESERWPNCDSFTSISTSLGVTVPRRYMSGMTAQVTGTDFVISATIANLSTNPPLNGDTLTLSANTGTDGSIRWIWGGDLDVQYAPKE